MKTIENGQRLSIYTGEKDMHQEITLCEAIVLKARELNLAGATDAEILSFSGVFSKNSLDGKYFSATIISTRAVREYYISF